MIDESTIVKRETKIYDTGNARIMHSIDIDNQHFYKKKMDHLSRAKAIVAAVD